MEMRRVILACLLCLCVAVFPGTCSKNFSFSTAFIASNPLRGFISYIDSYEGRQKFPLSMEYTYLALNDVLLDEDTYDFSKLENLLNKVASRNHQLVFRPYVDYPDCCPDGEYNSGVPDFLTTGNNPVTFTPYSEYGGGRSPNYENPRLRAAFVDTIRQLGLLYDGDPRIAFIQIGLLGFWGEWHTYPHQRLMASRSVQLEVLAAFNSSFSKTSLLVSADELDNWGPGAAPTESTSSYRVGWHDDNFGEATFSATNSQDWYFYPRLVERKLAPRYKRYAMAGEVQPTVQPKIFNSGWTGQNFAKCVAKTGVSWLLNQFAFNSDSNTQRVEKTKAAALMMGYKFFLSRISIPDCTTTGAKSIQVTIQNNGNAPFYYPIYLAGSITSATTTVNFTFPQTLKGLLKGNPLTLTKSVAFQTTGAAQLNLWLNSENVLAPIYFAISEAHPNGVVSLPIGEACEN